MELILKTKPMENNMQEKELYRAAKKQVQEVKGFYIHLLVYVLVNLFLLVGSKKISMTSIFELKLENFSMMFFWGIGLFVHWVSVFGKNLFLGKKWEERKIKELMEKDKKQMDKWE